MAISHLAHTLRMLSDFGIMQFFHNYEIGVQYTISDQKHVSCVCTEASVY